MTRAFAFHLLLSSFLFLLEIYFIKPRKKREICVNEQFKKTFTHIVCKILYNQQKIFEAEYKDIYKSPYNFSSYFDKGKQPKDYMYNKLLEIFIPQLTLISF